MAVLYLNFVKNKRKFKIKSLDKKKCRIFAPYIKLENNDSGIQNQELQLIAR